jgi:hypothetical protein
MLCGTLALGWSPDLCVRTGRAQPPAPDERHAMYGTEPRACGLGRALLGLAVVECPRLRDGECHRGGVGTPLCGAALRMEPRRGWKGRLCIAAVCASVCRPNLFGRRFGWKLGVVYDDYVKDLSGSACAIDKMEEEVVLHTQEVHGSSPCAPTTSFRGLRGLQAATSSESA